MQFTPNNREPVYLQVVRHFKLRIAKGLLQAGQEVPSRRELAVQLKINPNTVQKAYKEMEEQKLIVTEGNVKSSVTRDEDVLNRVKGELIGEAVHEFVNSVKEIGLSVDELVAIVKENYEKEVNK